jgi:hypothetical protein
MWHGQHGERNAGRLSGTRLLQWRLLHEWASLYGQRMLYPSASGHDLCRQVRECDQQLRPDRDLHVSEWPDVRQWSVLHAELLWEGLWAQRLWWNLRHVSNELDLQRYGNGLPVQCRLQTMRDGLYRQQPVLY